MKTILLLGDKIAAGCIAALCAAGLWHYMGALAAVLWLALLGLLVWALWNQRP